MSRRIMLFAIVGSLGLLPGCYQYTPPESALLGTVFNEVNREESDRILKANKLLTLGMAKEIALKNNQNLRSVLHAVNAAKMRYYQSIGAFAPQITAGTSVGQNLIWNNNRYNTMPSVPGREYQFQSETAVNASWLLFDGFARLLTTYIEEHSWEKERAYRAHVICLLNRSVAYAYEDMQLARTVEAIALRNQEFQMKLYRIVEPEFQKNQRPYDEVLNFKILAAYAETSKIDAAYQFDVADYALSQLMGYPEGKLPGTPDLSPTDTRIRPLPFDVDTAIDIALERNPQMHMMREALKIAEYQKFKSYSSYMPTFSAFGQFGFDAWGSRYQEFMYDRSSADGPRFSYGIKAEYLIFNGFTRYNQMREMQAAFAGAQFDMAEKYLQIVNDTRAAYANYINCADQAKVYRSIYEEALEQRNLVEGRYLRHDASVDRMDKVQQYYVSTEVQFAQQINLLNKAIAQLEMLLMIPIFPEDEGSLKTDAPE